MLEFNYDGLIDSHQYKDSIPWQLTEKGVVIGKDEGPIGTGGKPISVTHCWERFYREFGTWSDYYRIPVELLIACTMAESNANASSIRREPGYTSDFETPAKISVGLMQPLISTARGALVKEIKNSSLIDRKWLLDPNNNIHTGASYMQQQFRFTNYDPPLVAAAYNAGGIYYQGNKENRWKTRQYPIGTSAHVDRFIQWFNDAMRMWEVTDYEAPENSFYYLLNGHNASDINKSNEESSAETPVVDATQDAPKETK